MVRPIADLQPTVIILGVVEIAALVGLVILIVKGHRWFTTVATRAQTRAFDGVPTAGQPGPGLVEVVFHVYSGFLVFTRQVEYRFWATPDNARKILARLNRFNLTWGFFAYGAVFIPVLSLGNYMAQRARIRKQASRLPR